MSAAILPPGAGPALAAPRLGESPPVRIAPEGAVPVAPGAERADAVPFADVLGEAVGAADARLTRADALSQAFAAGALDDIHGTMIAMKEADISLRLVATVRNKLIDAFYELWRMNV